MNFLVSLGSKLLSSMSGVKPKVVFVLGGPGAGKGTQCANIVKEYGFVHLSAGDLLRAERSAPGTQFGDLIESHIKNGTIVPVEITCKLIERAMTESKKDKFLIDGFPRNKDNLDGWTREMSDKVELLFILFFDCEEEVCIKRCLGRGAAGSGRSDDNIESLKKRIHTFHNDSMPIIEHYKSQNMVRVVDANPDPDLVFQKVKELFDNVS